MTTRNRGYVTAGRENLIDELGLRREALAGFISALGGSYELGMAHTRLTEAYMWVLNHILQHFSEDKSPAEE